MDNWQRLAASGVKSEETRVPSQSVIGEKYLATDAATRRIGNGLAELPRVKIEEDSGSQSKCDW